MLEALLGNKNVERILLFLFVNGKGYGTLLHRTLGVPLTPLQKALDRLEKGSVIASYYEGKTRVYHFDPMYPLLQELESLLRKSYTLLPPEAKKAYYVVKEERGKQSKHAQEKHTLNRNQILLMFWQKLAGITSLTFYAKTHSFVQKEDESTWSEQMESSHQVWSRQIWSRKGCAEVAVLKEGPTSLIFQERGSWADHPAETSSKQVKCVPAKTHFTNSYRWKLDTQAGVISVEHLRRGPDHPVFLFHLAPQTKSSLLSVDSHLCKGDVYFGQALLDKEKLCLSWRAIGPKKNEEIDSYYA